MFRKHHCDLVSCNEIKSSCLDNIMHDFLYNKSEKDPMVDMEKILQPTTYIT